MNGGTTLITAVAFIAADRFIEGMLCDFFFRKTEF